MMEIKYQFPKDIQNINVFESIVKHDLKNKLSLKGFDGPNYFLLIIADWIESIDDRAQYEKKFSVEINSMNKWQKINKGNVSWKDNTEKIFKKHFKSYEKSVVQVEGVNHPINFYLFLGER